METCAESICMVETDASWIGQRAVTATVTDANMASTTDNMIVSVWNAYTMTWMPVERQSVITGLQSIVPFNVSVADGESYTQQQLGSNAGAFDSVVSFDMTVSNVFNPTDIGAESMTVDFDGDASTNWGYGIYEPLTPSGPASTTSPKLRATTVE